MKIKGQMVGWESPIAVHPGEFLAEMLEEFRMTQADLAERIGISTKVLNEIVKGKNPITRTTAFKLSKVFPVSAEYWTNLQQIYEADKARLEEGVRLASEVKNYLPLLQHTYKQLAALGGSFVSGLRWTEKSFQVIALELQRFFGVDSFEYIGSTTQVAFRKHNRDNLDPYALAAWIRIGEIKAQKTQTVPYDEKKLKASLPKLKRLSRERKEAYLPEIEQMLADCGIVVAYMPLISNTHAQGAAKWVAPDKVLLMLNTHKRDEGKFWFNLFHELGHILLHSKKECFVDLDTERDGKVEKEADEFAQKWLINDFDATIITFRKEMNTSHDIKSAVHAAAKANNVSDAIIAGRLTNEFKHDRRIYAIMNDFLQERIDTVNVL